jgi:hypothetical protein
MKMINLLIGVWLVAWSAEAAELQVYCGEPIGEALYDILRSGALPISHQLSQASSTERTDVFKLEDGRILAIFSSSKSLGETYSIKKILLGSFKDDPKKLKSFSYLKIPSVTKSYESK